MNLLNKKWYNRRDLKVEYNNDTIIVENTSDTHKFLIYPKIFKSKTNKVVNLELKGNLIYGTGCTVKIINRKRKVLGTCGLNQKMMKKYEYLKYFLLVLYIPQNSKIEITKAFFDNNENVDYLNYFHNNTLLVTPGYPSLENRYNTAFVHTRVKAYQKNDINIDVAIINTEPGIKTYEYEGVKVFKGEHHHLRELLQTKTYDKILIHFFDHSYANVLDSVDITKTKLYLYLHGAETLYRDWPKISSNYFTAPATIDSALENFFVIKDFFIKKYSNIRNAKWFFVTEWTKQRCEELLNIKFNNYDIIPCLIDTDLFSYQRKDPELRKKIFILRKFDNINSYAIDIDVRIILELSHRTCFKDLEFDIYGDGSLYEALTGPLKEFNNVHLHRRFLTHEEIRRVHEEHGIALFATRFDSQAVSSCEAAASGCAVVSSKIPGVMQFFDPEWNILCETENFKEYADVIERLYYSPEEFLKVAKLQSESVSEKFGYKNTIEKELEIFKKDKQDTYLTLNEPVDPILTIIVPSYNVGKYLHEGIISLLNHKLSYKTEILIINDGSKDDTAEIGGKLEKLTTINNRSIVKIINKENGGHGSTINKGIELAKGKYIKIMDGDDTVDSTELEKLVSLLENEDTDIILNNYIEDFSSQNYFNFKNIYDFLLPGIQYNFEDLCYEHYGFKEWGPILSCSTYKTEMLKKNNVKLLEQCFYVDMQLNTYVALLCKTIKYYPLNIYRYLLGQTNQSVSKKSYAKNYENHERVTIEMINMYEKYKNRISNSRKNYIINKLIIPMITTQYFICTNYIKRSYAFKSFDKKLKNHLYFYTNDKIATHGIKFYRITKGKLIFLNNFLLKGKKVLKKIFRRK